MPQFEDIVADFAFLDEWDDRYKYLIDLGRALPTYPESKRDEAHKVRGCASQVWVDLDFADGFLTITGDSDASIVKGLLALLISLYRGLSPKEALDLDVEARLAPLELASHLTPQRSNGIASMIKKIRTLAASAFENHPI